MQAPLLEKSTYPIVNTLIIVDIPLILRAYGAIGTPARLATAIILLHGVA